MKISKVIKILKEGLNKYGDMDIKKEYDSSCVEEFYDEVEKDSGYKEGKNKYYLKI